MQKKAKKIAQTKLDRMERVAIKTKLSTQQAL